jgi:hypothetical protein
MRGEGREMLPLLERCLGRRLDGSDALLLLGLHLNECESGIGCNNGEDRVIELERKLHPVQFLPIVNSLLRGQLLRRQFTEFTLPLSFGGRDQSAHLGAVIALSGAGIQQRR